MSRYTIRHDDQYEVVVGWDNPLSTFFAQVYDIAATKEAVIIDPDADDVIPVWVGAMPNAIQNLDTLRSIVAPYAVIESDIRQRLESDQLNAVAPTDLQVRMRKIMES